MGVLELFYALRESERELTVLKIKVKGERQPVIGTVERIIGRSEIVLKPYSLYGERILKTTIPIDRIVKIVKIHLTYREGIFPSPSRK